MGSGAGRPSQILALPLRCSLLVTRASYLISLHQGLSICKMKIRGLPLGVCCHLAHSRRLADASCCCLGTGTARNADYCGHLLSPVCLCFLVEPSKALHTRIVASTCDVGTGHVNGCKFPCRRGAEAGLRQVCPCSLCGLALPSHPRPCSRSRHRGRRNQSCVSSLSLWLCVCSLFALLCAPYTHTCITPTRLWCFYVDRLCCKCSLMAFFAIQFY